jgi:hypothetical protein
MTYIKLEDIQKILSKTSDKYQSEYTWWWIVSKIQEEILSLPYIDPQEMIKEMIRENKNSPIDYSLDYRNALRELLNKLTI